MNKQEGIKLNKLFILGIAVILAMLIQYVRISNIEIGLLYETSFKLGKFYLFTILLLPIIVLVVFYIPSILVIKISINIKINIPVELRSRKTTRKSKIIIDIDFIIKPKTLILRC